MPGVSIEAPGAVGAKDATRGEAIMERRETLGSGRASGAALLVVVGIMAVLDALVVGCGGTALEAGLFAAGDAGLVDAAIDATATDDVSVPPARLAPDASVGTRLRARA